MAQSSNNGGPESKDHSSGPPIWRAAFDAVERPVTRASETWVQSNTFMDGLAIAWRLQRRANREIRRGLDIWLGAWRLATRGDVDRLSNEVARVERELRALRRELADAETGAAAGRRGASASGPRAPRRSQR